MRYDRQYTPNTMSIPMPSPTTGVLLIHGLFGHPDEYSRLAMALQAVGCITQAISLPGHGTLLDQPISSITAEQVLSHCRQCYDTLANQVDQVVILGHSLGGICSLWLAGQRPDKCVGVIALAAPYDRAYWVNGTMDLMTDLIQMPPSLWMTATRYAKDSYTGLSSPSFNPLELTGLQRHTDQILTEMQHALSSITVPVFLGHSPYDVIIPFGEMQKLADHMTAPVVCHRFNDCGHQVFPMSRVHHEGMTFVLSALKQLGVED